MDKRERGYATLSTDSCGWSDFITGGSFLDEEVCQSFQMLHHSKKGFQTAARPSINNKDKNNFLSF